MKPEEEWFNERMVAFKNACHIIRDIGYEAQIDDIIKVAKFLVEELK